MPPPDSPSPRKPKGQHCHACGAHRLHYVRLSAKKHAGFRVRVLACSGCEAETPIPPREVPGIACRQCGNTEFRREYTKPRRGGIFRRKRCANPECGAVIHTREVVVCAARPTM